MKGLGDLFPNYNTSFHEIRNCGIQFLLKLAAIAFVVYDSRALKASEIGTTPCAKHIFS